MTDTYNLYSQLVEKIREAELLNSCVSLLSWDEQTCLPIKGGEWRSRQLSLLAGLVHEKKTDPRVGELLQELVNRLDQESLDLKQRANIRELWREYQRQTRLPRSFVEELARVTSLAQGAWIEARKDSNFEIFLPWLEQVIKLKREEAAYHHHDGFHYYDALLQGYEPSLNAREIQSLFEPLRDESIKLLHAILGSGQPSNREILERHYPLQAQRVVAESAAKCIGFDFQSGRLDESAHPFCSGIVPGDCRLTTRFHDHQFQTGFFGVLHEAGHGLYEQGLNPEDFGLPSGQACFLSVHESQSRLWENQVGRSRPFWDYYYPFLLQAFPSTLGDVSQEQFFRAINDVRPSMIRVEADEVTYNIHIMLRFELEQSLIAGDLRCCDLPDAWREKMRNYLSVEPIQDAEGCLQDIHWSAGLVGYFPTYTLGNILAAQFYATAVHKIPDLEGHLRRGEFSVLLCWLRNQIHHLGRQVSMPDLVIRVCGKPLSINPLVNYLWTKYAELYGV